VAEHADVSAPMTEEADLEALRVLLVDDHDLFRSGLRNLLEEQSVSIVGEASSGSEAVRLVRQLAPDVVVMDLNMPGMNGVEATRHITGLAPLTRVVVLTISDQDADVMDAILAGACGYLLYPKRPAKISKQQQSQRSGAFWRCKYERRRSPAPLRAIHCGRNTR
jgi:DNA-binding NarL/FixJ family response regulator